MGDPIYPDREVFDFPNFYFHGTFRSGTWADVAYPGAGKTRSRFEKLTARMDREDLFQLVGLPDFSDIASKEELAAFEKSHLPIKNHAFPSCPN